MPLRATPTFRAAWVPCGDQPWEEAIDLAISWVEQQCAEAGVRGLLVTNVVKAVNYDEQLAAFGRRHHAATPRSAASAAAGVPVLCYVPTLNELDFAIRRARGAALCVIEGTREEVRGWALAASAIDLTRIERGEELRPDPVDPVWVKAVERLAFYGNNGYGRGFGRDQAVRILGDVPAHQRQLLPAAVLAYGVSDRGAQELQKLIDRA